MAIEIAYRTAEPATRIGRPIWWEFGDVEAELLEHEVGSSDGKHPVSTAGGVEIDQAAVARTCRFAASQFQGSSSAMRLAG